MAEYEIGNDLIFVVIQTSGPLGKHIVYNKNYPDAIVFEEDINVDTDSAEEAYDRVKAAYYEYVERVTTSSKK